MLLRTARLCLVVFLLAFLSGRAFAKEVPLVVDGKSAAVIVLAENPTRAAQFAARELQYHAQKITGVELPLVHGDAPADQLPIFVGESPATVAAGFKSGDFQKQEYLVDVQPGRIILMGRDQEDHGKLDYADHGTFPQLHDAQATAYAVYDFLEKFCDVRWYLPTDLGIVYAPSDSLRVKTGSIRRSPAVKSRKQTLYAIPRDLCGDTVHEGTSAAVLPWREQMLWYHRSRIGGEPIALGHSLEGYSDRFWKKAPENGHASEKPHLEWFVLDEAGQNVRQLRYDNPELADQVAKDATAYFRGEGTDAGAKAEGDYFSVVPMDNTDWGKKGDVPALVKAEAERGKGLFSNDRASDYIFNFVAQVAQKVRQSDPDKKLSTIAYCENAYPPERVTLPSNVMVWLCLHVRQPYSKEIQDNDHAIFEEWKREAPAALGLWMYYCFPSQNAEQGDYRCFPGFFAHSMVRDLSAYLAAGITGIYFEPSYLAHGQRSVLLDQVEFYVTWKLADDPTLDGNALIDEFFTRYYGPAAAPMKEFYELVERIYADPSNYPVPASVHQNEEIAWGRLGTAERMEKLAALMEKAKIAAVSGPEKERVALFEKGIWEYMMKGREAYAHKEERAHASEAVTSVPRVDPPARGDWTRIDWEKGRRLDHWFSMKGGPMKRDVEARILHDGGSLYLQLEEKMDPKNLVMKNNEVWDEDYWEILIGNEAANPSQRFGISAKGALRSQDGGQVEGVQVASDEKDEKRWRVRVAIPLPTESPLYLNILRATAGRNVAVWAPPRAGAASALHLGELRLDEEN